jgi:hypothetical protein
VRMLLQLFRFCMWLLWLLRLIKLVSGYLALRKSTQCIICTLSHACCLHLRREKTLLRFSSALHGVDLMILDKSVASKQT